MDHMLVEISPTNESARGASHVVDFLVDTGLNVPIRRPRVFRRVPLPAVLFVGAVRELPLQSSAMAMFP